MDADVEPRIPPLAWLAGGCALLAIVSVPWALDQPWMNFAFKPAATLAIIAWAWRRGRASPGPRRWVLVGLGLSLAGDIALLWPVQGFLPGLVSFLLAHLAYLVAFTRERRLADWVPAFVLYALVAGAVLTLLWPGVPAALRLPVTVYVVALASMAAQALVLWRRAERSDPGRRRAGWLALGGALFLLSDALLATDRFAHALPLSSLWILASYWSAQWCIASWLAPAGHMPLNRPV